MNKKDAIKAVKYQCKKAWFKAIFSEWEWVEKTGREILSEARGYGYQIGTQTFYNLRQDIMSELDLEKIDPIPSHKDIKEKLDQIPDIGIVEMVDNAIKNIRGEK